MMLAALLAVVSSVALVTTAGPRARDRAFAGPAGASTVRVEQEVAAPAVAVVRDHIASEGTPNHRLVVAVLVASAALAALAYSRRTTGAVAGRQVPRRRRPRRGRAPPGVRLLIA